MNDATLAWSSSWGLSTSARLPVGATLLCMALCRALCMKDCKRRCLPPSREATLQESAPFSTLESIKPHTAWRRHLCPSLADATHVRTHHSWTDSGAMGIKSPNDIVDGAHIAHVSALLHSLSAEKSGPAVPLDCHCVMPGWLRSSRSALLAQSTCR